MSPKACGTNTYQSRLQSTAGIVSFPAVFRVVTKRSSPLTAAHSSSALLSLKLTNKEQASIFWKLGSSSGLAECLAVFLAANVTRNMIGAAANDYMHVIGSQ